MGEDFTNLWKNKQSDKPRASVIGGLQKLVEQKDNEIIELKEENINLKERLNQDVEILDQTEKIISEQKNRIEELEIRLDEVGSELSFGKTKRNRGQLLTPTEPKVITKSDSDEVKRLKAQVKSLEDKLYIFSSLPDRIATLEEQRGKDLELIEQFEDREKKLRSKIKAFGDSDSAVVRMEKMEDMIIKLKEQNQILKKQVNDLEDQAISPGSIQTGNNEKSSSEVIEWKEKFEKARDMYEQSMQSYKSASADLEFANKRISQLEKDVMIRSASTSIGSEESASLRNEINALTKKIDDIKQELSMVKDERDKLKSTTSNFDLKEEIRNLKEDKEKIYDEVEKYKDKLKESDTNYEILLEKYQEALKGDPDLSAMDSLKDKIRNFKGMNEDLRLQVEKLKAKLGKAVKIIKANEEKTKDEPPKPILPPTSNNTQKDSGVVIGGLVEDLKSKIEKQKRQIAKLKEINEELSQKTSGTSSAMPKSDNSKLNEEIAGLKNKLQIANNSINELATISKDSDGLKAEIQVLKKENAELKAKSSQQSGSEQGNLLELVDDLQKKINRLKRENLKLKSELK